MKNIRTSCKQIAKTGGASNFFILLRDRTSDKIRRIRTQLQKLNSDRISWN